MKYMRGQHHLMIGAETNTNNNCRFLPERVVRTDACDADQGGDGGQSRAEGYLRLPGVQDEDAPQGRIGAPRRWLCLHGTMRVELIGRFKPCMTEIYLHI